MRLPISVQLYTLRQETARDFIGTLEKVAGLGYKGVEFAGYGDIPAVEMKEVLDRLGLEASGSHVGLELLTGKLEEQIAYCLEIGCRYIICSWSDVKSREDFDVLAKKLGEIGAVCRERGLTLCYHNHAHEFVTFNGVYGLDRLYSAVDSQVLQAELDTYWVKYAGADPVEYVKRYFGRCPLIHIKDMTNAETKEFAEIGNGIINIRGIAAAAVEAGAKWLIVEQDVCKGPALESIRISMENLCKMGLA